jgi:hypothetical protein
LATFPAELRRGCALHPKPTPSRRP